MSSPAGDSPKPRVLIVGAGPAGLINARTLTQDGFDVTIVAKEDGVGGNWRWTYPDLCTNNQWGLFDFTGLEMAKPSCLDRSVVPAETYRRYLEDFYRYFLQGKVRLLTEVIKLEPTGQTGWTASLTTETSTQKIQFDKVVLATSTLGKPFIPEYLSQTTIPVVHTSSLIHKDNFDKILSAVNSTTEDPTPEGSPDTILVLGSGKSSMDAAAALANRGKQVVWAYRDMKWNVVLLAGPKQGVSLVDALFGPPMEIDSWAMWMVHRTRLGAVLYRAFWKWVQGLGNMVFDDKIVAPTTDMSTTLPHFSGGMGLRPTNFRPLVTAGRIATIRGTAVRADDKGVLFDGERRVQCGAIVVGTGWKAHMWDFIDPVLREQLGLELRPQRSGFEKHVLAMRETWTSVNSEVVHDIPMPMVYRGVLPIGRWRERDLAIAGGTRVGTLPAMVYEVESHWISSLLSGDPYMSLPRTEQEVTERTHEQNEWLLARYPGYDPKEKIVYSTFYTGFNDLAHTKRLLRDIQIDPWRQKSRSWWKWWDWLMVPLKAEQYATIGEEKKRKAM